MAEDKDKTLTTLAQNWFHAQESLQDLKDRVNRAETKLANLETALGKRLDPGDQQVDEIISTWVSLLGNEEQLIQSIKDSVLSSYRVRVRPKGGAPFPPKHFMVPSSDEV